MKVGEYIRTEQGIIAQCYKYEATTYFFDKCLCKEYGDYVNYIRRTELKNIIKKSSPNIIDLIEVGDYVNGERVTEITNAYIEVCYGRDRTDFINEQDIKSIVTKEQFSQMEYRIGE